MTIMSFTLVTASYSTRRPGLVKDLGPTNAALAHINRLLPDNPKSKESEIYRNKFSTLELVADACEMVFCGEAADALDILKQIQDRLQTTEEGKRRLMYQLASVLITVFLWIFFLYAVNQSRLPADWEPWMLAAGLAAAGGVFSVCLNVATLEVSVNQQKGFLLAAGATRSLIALLAGIALLLAMRSKMFVGIVYNGEPPLAVEHLTMAEMFFCFLAGFSESFVPNILRDSEKKIAAGNTSPPPATVLPLATNPPNVGWGGNAQGSSQLPDGTKTAGTAGQGNIAEDPAAGLSKVLEKT